MGGIALDSRAEAALMMAVDVTETTMGMISGNGIYPATFAALVALKSARHSKRNICCFGVSCLFGPFGSPINLSL